MKYKQVYELIKALPRNRVNKKYHCIEFCFKNWKKDKKDLIK